MARERSGAIDPFTRTDGSVYYRARIRLKDGSRERVDVPEKYTTDERRRLYAAAVQEREDERGELMARKLARVAAKAAESAQTAPGQGETCDQYRARLDTHRKELGRGGQRHDGLVWRRWATPHIGSLPIAKVTRDDIEKIRDDLDAKIAVHKATDGADGISAKTALNIWAVVTTTFKAAVNAKRRDLRVRADNPCTGVLPPERGEARRRTFIYPSELQAVVGSVAVALEWREAFAIGAYLYLRPGELRALTWGDIDLAAMTAHVTKAYDEDTDTVKAPKTTNGVRDVPIAPALVPLLERMGKGAASGELVVPIVGGTPPSKRAPRLVAALRAAGVTRPRLYESTATTMPANFRSLRDSGITWLALAGVDVLKMQRRAGHDDLATTAGYVKQAEDLTGAIGEPFGPLPASLLDGTMSAADLPPKSRGRRPHYQPKHWAKLDLADANEADFCAKLVEARGVEPAGSAENKALRDDSRSLGPTRDDVSARTVVDAGPKNPVGPNAPPTLRDDLAALVARAIREGNLTMAKALLDAQIATPDMSADVVTLDAERARRR